MLKHITADQYDELKSDFGKKIRFVDSELDFKKHYYACAPDEFDFDDLYLILYRSDIAAEVTNIAHCNKMISMCLDDNNDDYEDYEAKEFRIMKHNAQSRKSRAVSRLAKANKAVDKEVVYALKYMTIEECEV